MPVPTWLVSSLWLRVLLHKLIERAGINGFVAVSEKAITMQANQACRFHRENRRTGVTSERRTIMEDSLWRQLQDFSRGGAFDAEIAAEDSLREDRITHGIIVRITDRHYGITLGDWIIFYRQGGTNRRIGWRRNSQQCDVERIMNGDDADNVRSSLLIGRV